MLRLCNSLTGRLEPVQTRVPGVLNWYACGPTVYDQAHLGHARTYLGQDIIRRILETHGGLRVNLQMGITDLDDKIVGRARERGVPWRVLAATHEAAFMRDLRALGVRPPARFTRVTDHIPAIIAYIGELAAKGFAYRAPSGSMYFSLAAYTRAGHRYPKLAPGCAAPGAAGEKRDARDFALWRATDAEPAWEAFGARGRPGWHIECSAMGPPPVPAQH